MISIFTIVSDITRETIAGGAVTKVDTPRPASVRSNFACQAPISGVRRSGVYWTIRTLKTRPLVQEVA
jgi:hypothetical protein